MPYLHEPQLSHSQNFLRDVRLVDMLLDRSSITAHDVVYEIGPGLGIITERLARRCRTVVAVEKDRRLAALLHERFAGYAQVSIQAADFLEVRLPRAPFKVFASIPYAQTAAIVTRLTTGPAVPVDCYLVLQREAAARFSGDPRATLYATLLYPWFTTKVVHRFRRTDFQPVPRVESVLLRLRRREQALVEPADTQFFRDFVTLAFTAPQPSLRTTLRACAGRRLADCMLVAAQLDPSATPSMVPGTLWVLLFEHLKDAGGARARRIVEGADRTLRLQQIGLQKLHRTRVRKSHTPCDHPQPRNTPEQMRRSDRPGT